MLTQTETKLRTYKYMRKLHMDAGNLTSATSFDADIIALQELREAEIIEAEPVADVVTEVSVSIPEEDTKLRSKKSLAK